jgi:hypothetical protein
MPEYKVYIARYPIERVLYEHGKRTGTRIDLGKLDERSALSASIKKELDALGEGWTAKSIASSVILSDIVFTVLFEKL